MVAVAATLKEKLLIRKTCSKQKDFSSRILSVISRELTGSNQASLGFSANSFSTCRKVGGCAAGSTIVGRGSTERT